MSEITRTSLSHPLRIDEIAAGEAGGRIGERDQRHDHPRVQRLEQVGLAIEHKQPALAHLPDIELRHQNRRLPANGKPCAATAASMPTNMNSSCTGCYATGWKRATCRSSSRIWPSS